MQMITLYRYTREDGGITTSPIAPPSGTAYDTRYRLIADEGMALTDGMTTTACTDTDDPLIWTEIPAPPDEDADETAEKAQAYDILMGVSD